MRLPDDLDELAPVSQSMDLLYSADPAPLAGPGVPVTGWTRGLTVDYGEQNIYLVRRRNDTVDELVRVELATGIVSELTGPSSDSGFLMQPLYPAAEPASGSTRVAFHEWIGDTSSVDCYWLYFVNGVIGGITQPTTQAYAHNMTRVAGKVLSNGLNGRCRGTGSIVEIDPSSGATRTLVTGSDPDGR
jgi:hypothetical protein